MTEYEKEHSKHSRLCAWRSGHGLSPIPLGECSGFFATALAKQWDATLPYIEQHRLEKDTHNKTIQKGVESFRITDEQKETLKSMRS